MPVSSPSPATSLWESLWPPPKAAASGIASHPCALRARHARAMTREGIPRISTAFTDRWIRIRGVRLHSVESAHVGQVPIILIPGLAMSGRYFLPLARLLAEHHPVRVLELPGFGRSTGPRCALSMPEHAAWLHEWMQQCGIAAAHVVGHSMGCQVAAHFAAMHAGQVKTLTLIGPTVDIRARKRATQIGRLLRDLTREKSAIIFWAAVDVLRAGIVRTWRTSTEMLADPVEDQFARITAPTLLLRGQKDSLSPETWLETAARSLPTTSRWQTVPAAAHCVQFSQPAKTGSTILSWIDEWTNARTEVPASK